jgi:acetyl/propionyl-CoA carboxylase alpha subunit
MLRALAEYPVGGIPTTLPFFRWMLEQPSFVSGALDTTMLDAELERRDGEPFVAASAGHHQTALLATASSVFLAARRTAHTPATPPGTPVRSGWAAAARRAALRK